MNGRHASTPHLRDVLYSAPRVNLQADAKQLAELAIAIAKAKAGDALRDGINYLINVKENAIKTPLMGDYEKFILEETDETDLQASFQKLRAQVKA